MTMVQSSPEDKYLILACDSLLIPTLIVRDDLIVHANPPFLAESGYQPAELNGFDFFLYFIPSSRLVIQDLLNEQPNRPVTEFVDIIHQDGKPVSFFMQGRTVPDGSGRTRIFTLSRTDSAALREKVYERLVKENERMLSEADHRFKNSLQIINTLLDIGKHEASSGAAKHTIIRAQTRIRTIAMVHEMMFGNPAISHVPYQEFIAGLCQFLERTFAGIGIPVRFQINAEDLNLPFHFALNCGLILNELISFWAHHNRESDTPTKIPVTFAGETDGFVFQVAADGKGLSDEFSFEKVPALSIVRELAVQMRGKITTKDSTHPEFTVFIPNER